MFPRFSSLLHKMIVYGLLVSLLPVLALGTISYYMTADKLRDKSMVNHMQSLEQTRMRVEQNLKGVDFSLTQFLNSPLVNMVQHSVLEPEEYWTIHDLAEGLYRLQTYELGIHNVRLINYEMDWALDNRGFHRLADYEWADLHQSYTTAPHTSFWQSDSAVIRLVKKIPIHAKVASGLLVADIPNYELEKFIAGHEGFGQYLILDDAGNQLVSSEGELDLADISGAELQLANDMAAATHGNAEYTLSDQQVSAYYLKSSYNNWMYVSMIPTRIVYQESRLIGWLTLIICGMIMLISSLVIFVGSRSIYLPVLKLYSSIRADSGGSATGKPVNELAFISDRYETMLKDKSQLKDQLDSSHQQVNQYFMARLLAGQISPSEIQGDLARYGYRGWKRMCVFAVQIDSLDHTRYRADDSHLLMFAIHNITSELISEDRRMTGVLHGQLQVTIFGSNTEAEGSFTSECLAEAERIQHTLRDVLQLPVNIGLSRPYTQLQETSQAFREAQHAIKYRARMDQEAILAYGDFHGRGNGTYKFPEHTLSKLVDAIQLSDIGKAEQLLKDYTDSLLVSGINHQDYQIAIVRLFIELIREYQNAGLSMQELFAKDELLLDVLFELHTPLEMREWLREHIIVPMISIIEKRTKEKDQRLSDQMIQMIHEEFDVDLTLDKCAERLHYSKSYLKYVFRNEIGMSFSEYQSQVRLQIAKDWLVDTELMVSEIAEKLRYNNSQNFIRYFKKAEGITPGQFRQRARPDQQ